MSAVEQALDSLRAARNKTQQDLTQLDAAIQALGLAAGAPAHPKATAPRPRRTMSPAARRKIAAAQKARWAKIRKQKKPE